MQKTLFVHAGLHKTATTVVQLQLGRCTEQLKEQSLLIPLAGTTPGVFAGCHNLAHEITRHRFFRRRDGTLEQLERELFGWEHDALVSSEAFETTLMNPEHVRALADLATRCGYRLTYVVTLREQADYFRSLYLELLKHGYAADARVAAEEVLAKGSLSYLEWAFHFDFDRVHDHFSRLGVGVVFRNFHTLNSGGPLADLLHAIGKDGCALPEINPGERANQSEATATSLARFMRLRLHLSNRRAVRRVVKAAEKIDLPAVGLGPELTERFTDRFRSSNARLEDETGVVLNSTPSQPGQPARLEALFDTQTIECVEDAFEPRRGGRGPDRFTRFVRGVFGGVRERRRLLKALNEAADLYAT